MAFSSKVIALLSLSLSLPIFADEKKLVCPEVTLQMNNGKYQPVISEPGWRISTNDIKESTTSIKFQHAIVGFTVHSNTPNYSASVFGTFACTYVDPNNTTSRMVVGTEKSQYPIIDAPQNWSFLGNSRGKHMYSCDQDNPALCSVIIPEAVPR